MEITSQQLSGIYLVVDPASQREELLQKVEAALKGGVQLLQIWNHWPDGTTRGGKEQFIVLVMELAREYDVPVLINDAWELLKSTALDGVHFDEVPDDMDGIRKEIGRDFITGITVSTDLEPVRWAEAHNIDYISFCAMFPSPSAGSCAIVDPQTVTEARAITSRPIFLSGGITPQRMQQLKELDYDGIAVISGILQSDDPEARTREYRQLINNQS